MCLSKNLNVLDLGCGNGKNSNYICSLDATKIHAVGLDISETAPREARNRAYEMEIEGQVQYINKDRRKVAFPSMPVLMWFWMSLHQFIE